MHWDRFQGILQDEHATPNVVRLNAQSGATFSIVRHYLSSLPHKSLSVCPDGDAFPHAVIVCMLLSKRFLACLMVAVRADCVRTSSSTVVRHHAVPHAIMGQGRSPSFVYPTHPCVSVHVRYRPAPVIIARHPASPSAPIAPRCRAVTTAAGC